ncbi:hypothetical protein [Planosporangium mesophilum]|uniref:Uncharacterized protein n=1 Tax=Planosporangium mesophilum TaxID=689768 RepID=A0A8J3X0R5_9ACTN|nr:hypothetical protein [Planosporangium mesophilum]NJC82870.1 hypothetical protein [Planosporangium mesophilum]GII23660.1 hypothetical protein Pme01_32570 [Planosporangium mesophilum]
MADNELVIRFHPVGGDDVSLLSTDFARPEDALEAIARAVDERRSLVLSHTKEGLGASESAMVLNLANVVSVRVTTMGEADTTGPYL